MIQPDWETLQIKQGKNLPHLNCDNGIYHVCFRLADSIPREKMDQLKREKELILSSSAYRNRTLTKEEKERLRYLRTKQIEEFLDAGYGNCYLRRPEIAEIAKTSLQYFEGQRYFLHAWSIMPNHVHVIVEPAPGWNLEKIVHSWKSFTANMINKKLRRHGQLWQHEPYDHLIRNEHEYREQVDYVWNNPEKAGLANCLRWRRDR